MITSAGAPALRRGMEWKSEKIISVITKAKGTLTSIVLPPDAILSNSSVKEISKMTQLIKLTFDAFHVKPDGFASLGSLTELGILKLKMHQSLNELVLLFNHLKKLEEVEIHNIIDEVVESLVMNNPNLRHLDFSGSCPLTSQSSNIIAENCPQLTHIEIAGCSGFSSIDIQNLITACPNLRHANFGGTKINDIALGLLSHNCPELKHLSIARCGNVTEEGIEGFMAVATANKLRSLDITYLATGPGFAKRVEVEYPNITIVRGKDDDLYDDTGSEYSEEEE